MSSAGENHNHRDSAIECRPGRLWSLWDIMINFNASGLCRLLKIISGEETMRDRIVRERERQLATISFSGPRESFIPENIDQSDIDRIKGMLQYAVQRADALEAQSVHDRIEHFDRKLRLNHITHSELLSELRTLRETFESVLQYKRFYLYPERKAGELFKFEGEWGGIIISFPVVKPDAHSAVDLYAMNHNTASVFHSMRVAEHGLRALAKERRIRLPKNRPVEWGTWQDIIREIDKEYRLIGNKSPGQSRDSALEFYGGAIADLNGFKDEYRNQVMHVRKEYDENEARRALQRVHGFMERLSKKIDHRHRRIIWNLR